MSPEQRFEARLDQVYRHHQLSADKKRFAFNNFHAGYLAGAEDMRERAALRAEAFQPGHDGKECAGLIRALPLSPTPSEEASDAE